MSLWQQISHSFGIFGNISDEELMAKVKYDDDRNAFRALFERHHKAVFLRLMRMGCDQAVAEEVVQDVFLSVFRSRATYRDEAAFRPWITVMARHRLIDLHRAHAVNSWSNGQDIESIIDESEGLEIAFINKEERKILENSLAKLKNNERELIVLWMDDFSYDEIAQVVGKSVSAVKFALHQIKKKLTEFNSDVENV